MNIDTYTNKYMYLVDTIQHQQKSWKISTAKTTTTTPKNDFFRNIIQCLRYESDSFSALATISHFNAIQFFGV